MILVGIGAAILVGLLLLGGGEPAPTDSAAEPVAVVSAGRTAPVSYTTPAVRVDVGSDIVTGERETIELRPTIHGAETGDVTYAWTAQGALGFFHDPSARDAVYTTPSACDCEASVLLTLTVTDTYGVSASDSLWLMVEDPSVCPVDVSCEEVVCAEALVCTTEEPCPEPPVYETCPTPDVPCDSPCVGEVPSADPCGDVVIPCPCVAGDCGPVWTETWPFDPNPGPPADRPKPRIDRRYPAHLAETSSFQLSGTIYNPACVPGCFVWLASKGTLEGADTLTPTYRAPASDRPDGERVTISLILYDGFGGRSYDQIRLTIDNVDYDGPAVP